MIKPVWIFTLSLMGLVLILLLCPRHTVVAHKQPKAQSLSAFIPQPMISNVYRKCLVQYTFHRSMVSCGSQEWANYVAGMQQTSALKYACHVMGRDWNATTCCPFGQQQIGCIANLPCRCVTPKKRHFYTSWTGYS